MFLVRPYVTLKVSQKHELQTLTTEESERYERMLKTPSGQWSINDTSFYVVETLRTEKVVNLQKTGTNKLVVSVQVLPTPL